MPLLAGRFFALRCGTSAGVLKSFQVEAGEALADDRSVGIPVVTKVVESHCRTIKPRPT